MRKRKSNHSKSEWQRFRFRFLGWSLAYGDVLDTALTFCLPPSWVYVEGTGHRSTAEHEVSRLQELESRLGVVPSCNLLRKNVIGITLAGYGILKYACVVHVDVWNAYLMDCKQWS